MILILFAIALCISGKVFYLNENKKINEIYSPEFHAKGEYNNSVNQTGWAFLKITTNYLDQDFDQFYHAGFIEGYLTKDLIFDAYRNYVSAAQKGQSGIPLKAHEFVTSQYEWMHQQCKQGELYLDMVCDVLNQLEGMYDGYIQAILDTGSSKQYLDFNHFYYLTNMGDLEDIIPSFSDIPFEKTPNCNSLFKLTDDNKLIVGHNTHNLFSLMLRVYKTYNFPLHAKVSNNISFSSRPGDLESKDDFYVLKESKMVVTETSLNNYNRTNYQFLQPNTLPTWVRVTIASRLAATPLEWANIFGLHRSGTHNNQWVVGTLDDKKLLLKDSLVMVEESFYLYKTQDITQSLLMNNSYVASYNIAYDQEIYDTASYSWKANYTFWTDPRAIQLKILQKDIKTPLDLGKVIRSNLNQTYNLCLESICPRCDLSARNWTFGGIDAKVIDLELMNQNKVLLISSPTYQTLEAFNWMDHRNISHHGMPDEWKFPWFIYNQDTFTLEELEADC